MNARPLQMIALGLACLIVAGVAVAQQASPDRRERAKQFLQRFDADGDGRLSAEERAAAHQAVAEIRQRSGFPAQPQTVVPGETDLYQITPGPHAISVAPDVLLPDLQRGKQIPLRITFPVEGGPYPVIIFCHGALGSKDGAQPLVIHWASHGYVVIQPTFGDSISLMTAEERQAVTSVIDLVNSDRVKRQWDQRPADVARVLDALDDLGDQIPGLAGKIDAEKIVVGGHSYGAHTTMLLAGLTLYEPGSGRSLQLADPRLDAAFMISPHGTGGAITPASFQTLTGPILMITGDHDGTPIRGKEDLAGTWRRETFEGAPPGDKYLLWIQGAHHGFGGINGRQGGWPGAGPDAPDQVFYVKSTTLAFADAYAKDDPDARAYLASDRLQNATRGAATLTSK